MHFLLLAVDQGAEYNQSQLLFHKSSVNKDGAERDQSSTKEGGDDDTPDMKNPEPMNDSPVDGGTMHLDTRCDRMRKRHFEALGNMCSSGDVEVVEPKKKMAKLDGEGISIDGGGKAVQRTNEGSSLGILKVRGEQIHVNFLVWECI